MYADHHDSIHVQLENEEVWTEFNQFINENIVNQPGRRLFPTFNVLIDNLRPLEAYNIYVDLIERGRYAWTKNKWIKTHEASSAAVGCNYESVQQQHQACLHRDSPNLGGFWMSSPVSFARLKLTNRTTHLTPDQIAVKPMHMYEPRIQIVQHQSMDQVNVLVHSQTFPTASFIAVTAYQNTKIPKLKIQRNPFAQFFLMTDNRGDQERPQTVPVFSVVG